MHYEFTHIIFRIDFRNKFGAIHQSYAPDKSRELYSESSFDVVATIEPYALVISSLHMRHGHAAHANHYYNRYALVHSSATFD